MYIVYKLTVLAPGVSTHLFLSYLSSSLEERKDMPNHRAMQLTLALFSMTSSIQAFRNKKLNIECHMHSTSLP